MGQATPFALRKEIIDLRLSGMKHSLISEALRVPYSTVKLIWYRYQQRGEAGLGTDYAHSGVKHKRSAPPQYRATMWLKHLHPAWGAGRIRVVLLSRYPQEIVPSERTMQRWFREKKTDQTPPAAP